MSVTQKDIAQKLNISQAQVARALKDGRLVSDGLRMRIEETAREMGYDQNANSSARAMAMKRFGQKMKTGTIAALFPPLPKTSPRYMPFHLPVLNGIDDGSAAYEFDTCVCSLRGEALPRLIRDRNVDGVVAMGFSHRHIYAIRALDLPIVTMMAREDGPYSVMVEDRDGTRAATRHLLELGHRRIAYLGVKHGPGQTGELRMQGYLDALQEYGVEADQSLIETELWSPESTTKKYCPGCDKCAGCLGWQTLLAKAGGRNANGELPFTAVVCYNDPVAMGFIIHARAAGVQVPTDLSVTGFDDVSADYHFEPLLTSIAFDGVELGRRAVAMMHQVLENEGKEMPAGFEAHPVLPVQLMVRESTRALEEVHSTS